METENGNLTLYSTIFCYEQSTHYSCVTLSCERFAKSIPSSNEVSYLLPKCFCPFLLEDASCIFQKYELIRRSLIFQRCQRYFYLVLVRYHNEQRSGHDLSQELFHHKNGAHCGSSRIRILDILYLIEHCVHQQPVRVFFVSQNSKLGFNFSAGIRYTAVRDFEKVPLIFLSFSLFSLLFQPLYTGIDAPPGPRTPRRELVRNLWGFFGPGVVRSLNFTFC